jgi:hypothetical protein
VPSFDSTLGTTEGWRRRICSLLCARTCRSMHGAHAMSSIPSSFIRMLVERLVSRQQTQRDWFLAAQTDNHVAWSVDQVPLFGLRLRLLTLGVRRSILPCTKNSLGLLILRHSIRSKRRLETTCTSTARASRICLTKKKAILRDKPALAGNACAGVKHASRESTMQPRQPKLIRQSQ